MTITRTGPAGQVVPAATSAVKRPINAPKTKANIGLTWEDDISWGDYYLSGNVAYTDDYRTTQAARAQFYRPGRLLLGDPARRDSLGQVRTGGLGGKRH